MPAPETVELRSRSAEELRGDLEDAHQTLFNLRFQTVTRQLADVSQVSKMRRRIARIKTLLTEQEIIAEADQLAAEQADEAGDGVEASEG